MEEKEYIEEQQSIIESFFKTYRTYDVSDIGYKIVIVLFTFIQMIFFVLPYEYMCEGKSFNYVNGSDYMEFLGLMILFVTIPPTFYILSYKIHEEKGAIGSIYDKLKYLPLSLKALRIFRFRKMTRFILKTFLICAVLQLGISLLAYQRIMVGTLIHIGIYGFGIPFLAGSVLVWTTK